jgi:hypothetical protein
MKFAFEVMMFLNFMWAFACMLSQPDMNPWLTIAWISTILVGFLTFFIHCHSGTSFWCCYCDLNCIISLYKKFLTVLLCVFYVEYRLATIGIWTIVTTFLWALLILSALIKMNIDEEEKREFEIELSNLQSPRRRVSYLDE